MPHAMHLMPSTAAALFEQLLVINQCKGVGHLSLPVTESCPTASVCSLQLSLDPAVHDLLCSFFVFVVCSNSTYFDL